MGAVLPPSKRTAAAPSAFWACASALRCSTEPSRSVAAAAAAPSSRSASRSASGATFPGTIGMIRVFISDDHPVVRTGIRQIVGEMPDIVVVGEATTGRETLDLVGHAIPCDLILLD